MKRKKHSIGKVLLCLGIIVGTVGGIFLAVYVEKAINCTQSTTAVVVNWDTKYSYDDNGYSEAVAPVFYYEVDGVSYLEQYKVYSTLYDYELMQEVELLVDPDNPRKYMVADSIWMQLTAGICLGIGTILIIIGVVLFRKTKRKEAKGTAYYAAYTSTGPIEYKTTYRLNGVEHKIMNTDKPGYYNLNGKVVHRDDVSNLL